ncbi:MAG: hypothetical protein QOH17_441, partial [Pseudonocardiales bacterium]|nr:hypothetical protein [Pseudonocardiales bacterium]
MRRVVRDARTWAVNAGGGLQRSLDRVRGTLCAKSLRGRGEQGVVELKGDLCHAPSVGSAPRGRCSPTPESGTEHRAARGRRAGSGGHPAGRAVGHRKLTGRDGDGRAGGAVSDTRVLVAGASIAGPALAHWLRRRGAEVTVVERAPELRPGGQAVDARGVAKEVIQRMGLDAAVRAARTETAGAYTVDVDGNVLETFRADDDGGDGFIAEIEILRGDLSQVLYDDTRDGVEYVFGDRIAELTQDADGVDVAFAGGDRRRFDLVVGADGLHSALRAMVFGPHERFIRHLGHVLAFYTVPNEYELDRWLIDYQDQESGRSAGLRPIHDA